MYYYESPHFIPPMRFAHPHRSLFMAGGITGCPDWQFDLREKLINTDLTLINPRRKNFPIDDPNAAQAQIEWEHKHLAAATAVSFWVPCETLCPIVLFELGAWAYWQHKVESQYNVYKYEPKKIFVGVHPDYERKQDVIIQLVLQRPEVEVAFSLDDLAMQIIQWDGETD